MELESELATIKTEVSSGNPIEEKNIECDGGLTLDVYTQGSYLILEIPNPGGQPLSNPDVQSIQKLVTRIFGADMLPNPGTGTIKATVEKDTL